MPAALDGFMATRIDDALTQPLFDTVSVIFNRPTMHKTRLRNFTCLTHSYETIIHLRSTGKRVTLYMKRHV